MHFLSLRLKLKAAAAPKRGRGPGTADEGGDAVKKLTASIVDPEEFPLRIRDSRIGQPTLESGHKRGTPMPPK
jgi:hypothetical protein